MELEEELKVVGNSLKSLEVSEEKVINPNFFSFAKYFYKEPFTYIPNLTFFSQANQRVEEYKQQIKSLTVRLKEVSFQYFKILQFFTPKPIFTLLNTFTGRSQSRIR